MTTHTEIPAAILQLAQEVARIVREELGPDTRVWLFGSWAKGTAAPRSDMDLAFETRTEADIRRWIAAQDRIEHLPTLRSIDLVDLGHAGDHIRDAVQREGVEV